MKSIKTNNKEILVVEIDKDSYNFNNDLQMPQIDYLIEVNGILFNDCIMLRDYWHNSIKIIGKLSELTHNDCKELVESDSFLDTGDFGLGAVTYYRSYPNELKDSFDLDLDAKESFILLLQSEGIDLTKEYLILMI